MAWYDSVPGISSVPASTAMPAGIDPTLAGLLPSANVSPLDFQLYGQGPGDTSAVGPYNDIYAKYANMGWFGGAPSLGIGSADSAEGGGGSDATVYAARQQAFKDWMGQSGTDLRRGYLPGNKYLDVVYQGGQPTNKYNIGSFDDNAFGYAALLAAAIATGGVAAAGGGLGAAGTAGTAVGAGGGLSSADLAALYGNAGYGAGMTGAETAAFDVGLGSLGVGGLEALPAADYSLEGAHYGVGGLNPATASPINAIPGVPSGLEGLPGADYSHEGLNYGTGGLDPVTNAPVNVGAGAPTSALSNLSSSFKDWAAKNPMQAIQLAGTLGGKLFGGGQTISGGGIGSTGGAQADLTKNMPAAYSRQYVAPPAGYRPGISGEHVYFKKTGG